MRKYDSNGELVAVGYLVPNPDFIKKGEYKETELDRQKKQADILLIQIANGYYTLRMQKNIELKGRGIKWHNENVVTVTRSIYEKLETKYNIMCDF